MAHLQVRSFSCIIRADLEISNLTILIGPQASGKSVLSKLFYFFSRIINQFIYSAEDNISFRELSNNIDRDFRKAFPPQAWGAHSFSITFEGGPIQIKVTRAKPRSKSPGRLKWSFSDFIQTEYERLLEDFSIAKKNIDDSSSGVLHKFFNVLITVQNNFTERLRTALGKDYLDAQLFVPAGRAFFTSMGKAVVAFEQGGYLDPLTIRFGQHFLTLRDMHSGRHVYRSQQPNRQLVAFKDSLSQDLFGGEIKLNKDEEYVQTTDGRRIPFSYLSSGQQELLPLWLTLDELTYDTDVADAVYIEEPEAHLFPAAQSILIQFLTRLIWANSNRRMIITTHSPYLLAKINNFLKAGQLAAILSKTRQQALEKIIARPYWLSPGTVKAYAIIDHNLFDLIEEDGLIDGDYLDNVSGDIAVEFNRILEFEVENEV